MRRLPSLFLLLLSIVLAGCSGGSDEADAPTGPAPEGDAAGGPGQAGAAPEPFTTRIEHDHTGGSAREEIIEIPAGAGPLELAVSFEAPHGAGTCVSQDARVVVVDPSGETRLDRAHAGASSAPGATHCGPGNGQVASLSPGAWTVRFSGTGVIVTVVEIGPPSGE